MRSGSCSLPSKCRPPHRSGTAWQIFSGFPARIVPGPLPETIRTGGGKYRISWVTRRSTTSTGLENLKEGVRAG
jgi:hypothetical protein